MSVPGKNDVGVEGERRKAERYRSVDSLHMVLVCEGRHYDCYLEDISLEGLGLRVEAEIPLGGVMILRHPVAGDFRLKPLWVEAKRLGARFHDAGPKLEHTLRCIQLVLDAPDPPSSDSDR
jgi:hypothetical protein